jgi:hypothetical protein
MAFVVAAIWKARPREDYKASEHFQQHVFGHAIDYLADRQVSSYETIDV